MIYIYIKYAGFSLDIGKNLYFVLSFFACFSHKY